MNSRAILGGGLALALLAGGLWLLRARTTELLGTWESESHYLVFTAADEGDLYIQSRDCTGWPATQQGNATVRVRQTNDLLTFPGRPEQQSYRRDLFGEGLWVDAGGPIPAGVYSYHRGSTFAMVGICGLQP